MGAGKLQFDVEDIDRKAHLESLMVRILIQR